MEPPEKKLLFRLQHIIPQNLSPALPASHTNSALSQPTPKNDMYYSEEIEFQMPWGKVAGKAWGPPNGLPVIALHGWLDNAASFDQLIPLLPRDLRIICIDIPGHGYSDHYPLEIQYHYIDCIPAFERVVQQLNWETFYLIGHSLGGAMALFYAEIFPEKVKKLVMLDVVRAPITRPETIGRRLRIATTSILKEEQAIKSGPEKPCSYEVAIKRSIRGSGNSLDEKACKILFSRGLAKVGDEFVFRRDRRLRSAPLDYTPKEDQLVLARQVTAEVLVIKCKDGPYFESSQCYNEQMEALKTKSWRFEYHEVEGNHHAHLTHPQRMAPLISAFLSS